MKIAELGRAHLAMSRSQCLRAIGMFVIVQKIELVGETNVWGWGWGAAIVATKSSPTNSCLEDSVSGQIEETVHA
jgi:hypothetical protein